MLVNRNAIWVISLRETAPLWNRLILCRLLKTGASFDERLQAAYTLLENVPLIDAHNDLPYNIRKFVHNQLSEFNFDADLKNVPPWSNSNWSHTDLQRMKKGHVAAQVRALHFIWLSLAMFKRNNNLVEQM